MLKELLERATPRPWRVDRMNKTVICGPDTPRGVGLRDMHVVCDVEGNHMTDHQVLDNTILIAHAVNMLPGLVNALAESAVELDRLRGLLLPQYAGKMAEPSKDIIDRAFAALAKANNITTANLQSKLKGK